MRLTVYIFNNILNGAVFDWKLPGAAAHPKRVRQLPRVHVEAGPTLQSRLRDGESKLTYICNNPGLDRCVCHLAFQLFRSYRLKDGSRTLKTIGKSWKKWLLMDPLSRTLSAREASMSVCTSLGNLWTSPSSSRKARTSTKSQIISLPRKLRKWYEYYK